MGTLRQQARARKREMGGLYSISCLARVSPTLTDLTDLTIFLDSKFLSIFVNTFWCKLVFTLRSLIQIPSDKQERTKEWAYSCPRSQRHLSMSTTFVIWCSNILVNDSFVCIHDWKTIGIQRDSHEERWTETETEEGRSGVEWSGVEGELTWRLHFDEPFYRREKCLVSEFEACPTWKVNQSSIKARIKAKATERMRVSHTFLDKLLITLAMSCKESFGKCFWISSSVKP